MRRIALCIEYDGTDYCGWQRQHNGIAVQQVLEEALEKVSEDWMRDNVYRKLNQKLRAL